MLEIVSENLVLSGIIWLALAAAATFAFGEMARTGRHDQDS